MPDAAHSPARLLAPLALAVCAIAFFVILLGSDVSDDGDSESATPTEQTTGAGNTTTREAPRPQKRTYTVQTGDTLGGIAEQTGIEVEELQRLNPDLDPQALVAGQKIKLRE